MKTYEVAITGEFYVIVEAESQEDAVHQAFDLLAPNGGYFKDRDVNVEEV